MLGEQIGVTAQAVAGAVDLDDDGVVEQAVEQRGRDDGATEDFAPFGKAAVGREDHGALFVAGVDQLADSDDRAQPFQYDGAQHSDMIAIRSEHSVEVKLVASTGACVNR